MILQMQHNTTSLTPAAASVSPHLPADSAASSAARLPGAVPLSGALPLAIAGGLLLRLAFPGPSLWPLAVPGIAAILLALRGRGPWTGLLLGALAGLAFYGPLIEWATVYLGPVPWLALTGAMAVYFALMGLLIALAYRWSWQHPVAGVRHGVAPLVVAALWTLREFVAGSWPYGGFSWGRVAQAFVDAPIATAVAWIGTSGLSFAIVVIVAALVQVLVRLAAERDTTSVRSWGSALAGPIVAAVVLAVLPSGTVFVTSTGSLRVGAVQGNADAALNSRNPPGTILNNHVEASRALVGADLDVVLWPENASDRDPLRFADAARVLDLVSSGLDAPLVTGTITKDGDRYFNSALLWQAGQGAVDQYDKKHPVPFAEYVPDRWFYSLLVPDLIGLVTRDYQFGERDALFTVREPGNGQGAAVAGIAICFDIVDDDLMIGMVRDGATVLFAPTNNADFGRTDQHLQQFDIARMRAMETGRALVQASTVATSGVALPDGTVTNRLPTFTPGAFVADVPTYIGTTPAVALGRILEWIICLDALLALLWLRLGMRKGRPAEAERPSSAT